MGGRLPTVLGVEGRVRRGVGLWFFSVEVMG